MSDPVSRDPVWRDPVSIGSSAMTNARVVRRLGRVDYVETLEAMRRFTDARDADTLDEYWLLEHSAVFTQGQAGRSEHVLAPGDIPVVASDRGGQVTYHGPGQLVVYLLLDIRRLGLNVRSLVRGIESALVAVLRDYNVAGALRNGAPGVYSGEAKVASLGLRVRKGRSFHGLALNVDMDLEPFGRINPCGYAGLEVTDLRTLGVDTSVQDVEPRLIRHLDRAFGFAKGNGPADPLD